MRRILFRLLFKDVYNVFLYFKVEFSGMNIRFNNINKFKEILDFVIFIKKIFKFVIVWCREII